MPTGYASRGKTYIKSLGKWVDKEVQKAFDYEAFEEQSVADLINFFRWYPDYFADLCRSETASYKLALPQRMMLRINARYRNTYITGCRGLTKTYIILLGKMIKGILYPGVTMRYFAPSQKQAAALAAQAFAQIEKDYPLITSHWQVKNNRDAMFRIVTAYGSEFAMYAPRGDNCTEVIAEEIGQEGEDGFDMDKYEKDILPTCRIKRSVNQQHDKAHIDLQHAHISNACGKQNRAYNVHRAGVVNNMLTGEEYEGYVIDFSWVTALVSGLRDKSYIDDMRKTLTATDFLREMCARYVGSAENPMLADEVLAKSKKLKYAEFEHCGDPNAIYIVSHDVSYADGRKNAKCADVVLKLTTFDGVDKRDKYLKQAVFVDNYPPPETDYAQAQKLKALWKRYCRNGCQTTYLVVDTQAYGTSVVEELMKPTDDGSAPLCCVGHNGFNAIEQPNALPVIYPLKAEGRGAVDNEGAMIRYAQAEFEQGNVELLITNAYDGVEAYKTKHRIKDNTADGFIAMAYKNTELLTQQISNLRTKVSGVSLKEERKSKAIQRDCWSALKYALRFACKLEGEMKADKYTPQTSWQQVISGYAGGETPGGTSIINTQFLGFGNVKQPNGRNTRVNLLANRKVR